MSQPGLFATPQPEHPPQSTTVNRETRLAGPDERPRWARYRPRDRVQCSECVLVLHENRGVGPAILGSRWRLTIGRHVWYLCGPHADLRRQEQGK
jgi:hypothetical protein